MRLALGRIVAAILVVSAPFASAQEPAPVEGVASWYGEEFHGRPTANGEVYDMEAFTAAHRTLAFGTRVRVTNLDNGRQVVVRINDRGPFVAGRIIDLSRAAATFLDMLGTGVCPVSLEILALPPPEAAVFAVQVGAFVREENATRVQRNLREAGIEAVLERTPSRVTRVIVDHVSEADLEATLKLVAALGFTDSLVRKKAAP